MKKIVLGLIGMIVLLASAMAPVANAKTTGTATGSGGGYFTPGTCPAFNTYGIEIGFSATSAAGTTSGTWGFGFGAALSMGTITGGHINHNHYNLDGVMGIGTATTACGFTPGTPISIRGLCGTGVTITWKVGGQLAGTFTGDVTCT